MAGYGDVPDLEFEGDTEASPWPTSPAVRCALRLVLLDLGCGVVGATGHGTLLFFATWMTAARCMIRFAAFSIGETPMPRHAMNGT